MVRPVLRKRPACAAVGSLALLVALAACPSPDPYVPPGAAAPMTPLNTAWDDYNAAPDPEYPSFVWSSNRASQGGDFDVFRADIVFGSGGEVRILDGPALLAPTHSSSDELGPIHQSPWGASDVEGSAPEHLVFASNRPTSRGGLDLYRLAASGRVENLEDLNTPEDEAYWTFLGGDHVSAYLASNRGGGRFDIYRVTGPGDTEAPFGGPDAVVEVVSALSSDADDTAPYLFEAWDQTVGASVLHMVFASDREGGVGGFDLYVSRFVEGRWDTPRNLGDAVNSTSDEFRPSVSPGYGILAFSSNRPGGKGGFDLYHAAWASPFDPE